MPRTCPAPAPRSSRSRCSCRSSAGTRRRCSGVYKAAAARVGFAVDGEFTGGCADSGFTAALGVPTLCGLGPVGGKAHTDEEFCRLDTLLPRTQALAAAICALA